VGTTRSERKSVYELPSVLSLQMGKLSVDILDTTYRFQETALGNVDLKIMVIPLEIDFVESYDRETLIQELRRIANALEKPTLSRREIDSYGRISSGIVIKRFGSLRRALQESGLTPTRFMKATNAELSSVLVELWTRTLEKFGRSPYRTDLRAFGFPVSGDTYTRRFGSWNKALLAAAESMPTSDDTGDAAEEPAPSPASAIRSEGRRTLSVRTRFFVFKRDHYRCRICRRSGIELEVDHKVPVAQGGSDALDNLQTLCFDCNRGKRQSSE
jgi:HNH endonuclease/Homing endonuclease associated repeat